MGGAAEVKPIVINGTLEGLHLGGSTHPTRPSAEIMLFRAAWIGQSGMQAAKPKNKDHQNPTQEFRYGQ